MRLKYIILYTLLCFAFSSQAQPGYQGKKVLVIYDYRFVPTLGNRNFNSERGLLPTALSAAHVLSVEKVVSRKTALGFRYSFSRSSVNINLIEASDDQAFNIYANLTDLPFKSYVHGIGFYSKHFYSGHENLAPRGSYVSLHLDAYYSVLKDSFVKNTTMVNYWGNYSFGLGFGKQVIAFDRLIFDYGFESNLCIPGIPYSRAFKNTDIKPDQVKNAVDGRTFDMYIFMLKLGIGFLAH